MSENSYWNYHFRQYKEMYRSTQSIIDFLKDNIPQETFHILDVGCGGVPIFIG